MTRPDDAFDAALKIEKESAKVDVVSDPRPRVFVNSEDSNMVLQKAIELLAKRRDIYRRAGFIVTVIKDEDGERIFTCKDAKLQNILAQEAVWMKPGAQGVHAIIPPDWLVKQVSADGSLEGVKFLDGIISWPAIRKDWSIIQDPGYDEASRLIYSPTCKFEDIPSKPSQEEVRGAKDDLMEVIEDFPMDGDEHRAAWLAALLTIMGRDLCPGPTPLFMISANVQGVGKSMVGDAIAAIALGKPMLPRVTYTDDEPEMRKSLTSHFLKGSPAIFLDNCEGQIGCPPLSAAITGMLWEDRLLGTQDAPTLGIRSVFLATGNNLKPKQDLMRRIIPINMTTKLEHPERRAGFKHSPLIRWVLKERPRLVVSAMIILRGYFTAGKPRKDVPPLGSFEEWEDIRQAVMYTGLPDPLLTRNDLEAEGSSEALLLERFIEALWDEIGPSRDGITASEILAKKDGMNAELKDVLSEFGSPRGPASAQGIGRYLNKHLKVVINKKRINSRVLNGKVHYFVEEVTE